MTTDQAKQLVPGNRVFDWAMLELGTVHAINRYEDSRHFIKVAVRFDGGWLTEYYDEEVEYLDRE